MIITVDLSTKYFIGFRRNINSVDFESISELCNYMKKHLVSYLQNENLVFLITKANKLDLHSHDYTFYDDILKQKPNIVYLCDKNLCNKL